MNIQDKRIIYKNENGGVSVIIPSSESKSIGDLEKSVPNGFKYILVDNSDIPSDRTFRDAWELSDD